MKWSSQSRPMTDLVRKSRSKTPDQPSLFLSLHAFALHAGRCKDNGQKQRPRINIPRKNLSDATRQRSFKRVWLGKTPRVAGVCWSSASHRMILVPCSFPQMILESVLDNDLRLCIQTFLREEPISKGNTLNYSCAN